MKSCRPAFAALLFLTVALLPALPATLPLHSDRSSPFDLVITGGLQNVPSGATRYVRYADLRALPTTQLRMADEFIRGEQEVTVVFLSDLWQALPVAASADCVVATCNDLYLANFRQDFIATYRPFLVLEINGAGPEKWARGNLIDDPGPYAITVSSRLVPAADRFLSVEHKKPWGVVSLEFARFADKFGPLYAGPWAGLSARAAAGREIWINSCACCHLGPGQAEAVTKSGQPFSLVDAVARGNPGFLKQYVRAPTSVVKTAKMEAHPYFTDGQLDAIIAFITAEH